MANGGEDLTDFLKREDEKLAEIEDLNIAQYTTPPPDDLNLADSDEGDEHTHVSPLAQALEMSVLSDQEPPSWGSSQPVVIQRRTSLRLRAPSTELTNSNEDLYGGDTLPQEDAPIGGEPECIQSWRQRKEEMLDQKEAEASEEMRRWRESAQQELRDWYDHHNSQVETRKQDNRAAEEAFINERDQSVPGTEWEKVSNLCEFSGKTPGKTSKDVSRMRSIYLHLKENPPIRN